MAASYIVVELFLADGEQVDLEIGLESALVGEKHSMLRAAVALLSSNLDSALANSGVLGHGAQG